MHLLQRLSLRRQNTLLSLRYAFASIKLHLLSSIPSYGAHVSFRDGQFLSQKTVPPVPSSHSIQLQNKQLYLRYVQEVLTAKEQQLVQLQEHLTLRRTRLDEEQAQQRMTAPLALLHQAEMLAKKAAALKEVAFRVASSRSQAAVVRELEQFQSSLAGIQKVCKRQQETAGAQLQQVLEQLAAERQELAAGRSKLGELSSYQKYLSDLQSALEQKEYQVIMRQRQFQQMSLEFASSNTQTMSLKQEPQYNTYQQDSNHNNNDHSIRKRARIFEPRPSSSIAQIPNHKESSKIMMENSTNDYTKQKISKGSEVQVNAVHAVSPVLSSSAAVQTVYDNQLTAACMKLQSEQAMVKFLRLWVKFSEKVNKGGQAHQKTMVFYRWRLNALFEQQARRKIESALCWPKKLTPIPDYKDLSLKRKKYHELFFEHQRRLFHREKTLVRLRTILKNKNRRQRTAVLLSFQRFRNNAKMMSLMALFQGASSTERVLQERASNPVAEIKPKTASRTDSRILVSSTSNNEHKIASEPSKGKLRQTPSTSTVSKSRVVQHQAAIDIPKLKQYIKNQEQTQVKLATECARTESIFRLCTVLGSVLCRTRTRFIVNAIRIGQTGKLNALQKAMNGCQFKWQLFMAKARLSLTTNTNKIAHLEQLVGFMDSK